ncbi:MAG: response regulator transcription factor [Thermoleophilia bacterium]
MKDVCDGKPSRGVDSLTEREKEILKLIADGLTNKEIAEKVFLSEKTVRNHITSIFLKLGVSHRTQAAIYYRDRNPTDLE